MKQRLVTLTAALAVAAAGGLAFAQSDSASQSTNNGAPGVEANVGANARDDGGLPGVEMNVGANGDQQNIGNGSANDTSTLGAGPASSDTSTLGAGSDTTDTTSGDLNQPRADRN